MANSNRCDQCLTQGITILPTRWGCRLNKSFLKKSSVSNILFSSRLLREGYIYILDNNGEWYGYAVTQGRYLKQFDVQNTSKTPDLPISDYTCHRGDNCTALNSFIRIPNPNNDIETLWCAYSPVKWTPAVIERHQNNINDAKTNNMIEVPVSTTQSKSKISLGTGESQNGGGYDLWRYDPEGDNKEETYQYLALEYFDDINPFTEQLYSPNKSDETKKLSTELSRTEKNGNRVLSVNFNDTIGKLIDLNEFMIQAKLAYRPSESAVQGYTVAKLINTLRDNIDQKAKADAEQHIARVNTVSDAMQTSPRWEGDGPSEEEQQVEEQRRQEGALKYTQSQRQGAWSDYSKLIRESEMDRWLSNFEARSMKRKKELNNMLISLSSYYSVFLKDKDLKTMMTQCFDKNDELSCIYYTLTVQQFVGATATIPGQARLYDLQLSEKNASDEDNYLARALIFNQDKVAKYIDGLTPVTRLTTDEIVTASWSGLFNTGSSEIFKMFDEKAKQLGVTVGLAEQLAIPFMEKYGTSSQLNNIIVAQKEYLFGYHHEKALIIVQGKGTFSEARTALKEGISRIAGTSNLPTRMRYSIDEALKITGENTRLNNSFSQDFLYHIDKSQVKNSTSIYQSSQKAIKDKGRLQSGVASSVSTSSIIRPAPNTSNTTSSARALETYNTNVPGSRNYNIFKGIVDQNIDLATRSNYFGGMLQSIACVFLVHSFFIARAKDETGITEGAKAAAGLMVLIAGGLELRGNASQLMVNEFKLAKNAGKSVDAKKLSDATRQAGRLSIGARLLGIGGAAIFAGFDFNSGNKAGRNDDGVMQYAYYGSAATGIGSTLFLTLGAGMAATGIGVVLLIGFIGINLFIGYWHKTGMENWLKHSIWGTDSNNWSLEHTLKQFDHAVAGEDIDLRDN
ncbi:T6SS effector BTH_I2691 family protein [Psychrobacter sp. FME5]|uniref:T6SS effector BTH_I2691 family protein n=1 Tax=unclassified Psychrobacter TaxID=196806 RepID=UPI0017879F14|nr:T6SS effector BTH_I2691 family protein [Psychrobacter sp. FME5]MBE0444810.1 hypothetical protein [Psychrobacter sp. FME5]